jgi:hypothetical protein
MTFYGSLAEKLELARVDQFHWKNEAYAILAAKTVSAVSAALPDKIDPHP